MYGTGTVGLQECWAKLAYLIASQLPANEQSQPSYRTIALPVSLSPNAQLAPSRFVTTNSRCAEDVPLDTKATSELIRALLTALNSNLMILPLVNSISGPKIILPPLLRFVSGGCCGESSHAHYVGSEGHGDDFLKKIVHLRKVVKTELIRSSLTGYWVADPVVYLLDSNL